MLLIKSPGIDASTVDSRSALKWECPKNVSGVSKKNFFFLFALSINMIAQRLKSSREGPQRVEFRHDTDDISPRVGINRGDMKIE